MILGSVFSRDINLAIPSLINYIAEGLGLYFLLINTIRTPTLLKQVVWSLLIGGALIGALSLFQQVTETWDNNYWGFAQVTGRGFTTEETIQGTVTQPRVSGPIGEKNRFAQVMLMLGERLVRAGYASKMIPLFAIPTENGTGSGKQIEGSIKGEGAVVNLQNRLKPLLEQP
jgi:hypothetical protein